MRHFIHTEPSLQSRCFLRETQRFFNAAAILKRQGKDWGRRGGNGERGGEERGEFFPLLLLFYFKPINLYQLLTRSQLSGSINVQDGGITLLPENNHGLRCKIRPLCRPHGTVQYFRSVHTKLTNQVDFFFSVLQSAHSQRATQVNPKWLCPAELTSIHATMPLPYKMLNGHSAHIAPIKFCFSTLAFKLSERLGA